MERTYNLIVKNRYGEFSSYPYIDIDVARIYAKISTSSAGRKAIIKNGDGIVIESYQNGVQNVSITKTFGIELETGTNS